MATIIPTFRYDDARAAITFLKEAFGFEEHAVYEQDGVVLHAELKLGDSYIMLGQQRDDAATRPRLRRLDDLRRHRRSRRPPRPRRRGRRRDRARR